VILPLDRPSLVAVGAIIGIGYFARAARNPTDILVAFLVLRVLVLSVLSVLVLSVLVGEVRFGLGFAGLGGFR
jgi:hypothetical protein